MTRLSTTGDTAADPAPDLLADSRRYCMALTRSAAKNFYYGLKLLPEPKRGAMFALYAYLRLVDDIADAEDGRSLDQRVDELAAWREQTHAALAGQLPEHPSHPVWPAFAEMARGHAVPQHLFDEMIAGQQQDLEPLRFETFDELREYCYRVAGVVGLASVYVWGFEGGEATEQLAIQRGIAFQLTNILRDLREDAARGRIYLPRQELAEMGVSEHDLLAGRASESFRRLMRSQIARAQAFYNESAGLEERISRDSRPTLVAMTEIYHGLLQKVAADPARVLRERVSLSLFSKLRIGWRASRTK